MIGQPSLARVVSFALAARTAVSRDRFDVIQSHERTLLQDVYGAGEGCHRAYLAVKDGGLGALKRAGLWANPYHRALLSSNGDYFLVGIDWWEWVDKVVGGENMNFGLVTMLDNAYDGKEDVIALGTDPWGFHTGGELRNYGDFLTAASAAHAQMFLTIGGATSPLTVSITSPADGDQVVRHSVVSIYATTSADVGVTVDFYVNATLKCSIATPPYRCNWRVPRTPAQTYKLQARARDAQGNTAVSSVTVTSTRR